MPPDPKLRRAPMISQFSLPDWLMLSPRRRIAAALISAVATLALIVGFLPPACRSGARRRRSGRRQQRLVSSGSRSSASSRSARRRGPCSTGSGATGGRSSHGARRPSVDRTARDPAGIRGPGALWHTVPTPLLRGHDGTAIELMGQPRAGAAWFAIRPASEDARALRTRRPRSGAPRSDAGFLRSVLDHAPVSPGARRPTARSAGPTLPIASAFRRAGTGRARPSHPQRLRPCAGGGPLAAAPAAGLRSRPAECRGTGRKSARPRD